MPGIPFFYTMNVLLHMCCGPCAVAVIERLLDEGHKVTGFFFNPNIHPLSEYMRRRETEVRVMPKLPAHVVANKALVELNNRKLWQNGKFKQYYTALTSIIRVYISDRWGISALELTTDETIEALHDIEMPLDSRMALVAMLRTADMVKFAKAEPEAEENEENYIRAYYFVENTKLVDEAQNEGKEDITIYTNIGE